MRTSWLATVAMLGVSARALRLSGHALPRSLPLRRNALCGAAHVQRHLLGARMMCTEAPAGTAVVDGVPVDENGQPLSKNALKKLAKAAATAQKKAQKAAERVSAEEAGAAEQSETEEEEEEPPAPYGFRDVGVLMSSATPEEQQRVYCPIRSLGTPDGVASGQEVWVRGRVSRLRAGASNCFLVLRAAGQYTVQAVFFKDKATPRQSKEMISALGALTEESVLDIRGKLVQADVRSCSQANVELQIIEAVLISASLPKLPFQLLDAGRSEAEIVESEKGERPFVRVGQEQRLNSRWIDLRVPAQHAIMRAQSHVCTLFREALLKQGFTEIHTPKIIAGESEGGSGVFTTDYFGRTACLAQSPQLYKQMAIAADLERVFEIGPVFRAEKSNTRRHLCEFVGLDIEMAINLHYNEVIGVLHAMLTSIFDGLETRHAAEMAAIRAQFPSSVPRWTNEPCIVHWEEANEMLEKAVDANGQPYLDVEGKPVGAPGFEDLSTAQERLLGQLVADKYGTDLVFVDRYPRGVRPFYTMPCADDPRYTNSYDVLLRGEEICSGAQRIHDPEMLVENIKAKGASVESLQAYIDSMRYGMPPHGGGGIGLERLVFLYLGLDNVRKASMFPRDPNRCSP
jgi:aspartyl-tRNA synthetase